jgi:predicted HAD superfamily Cof-like phosphohydrolase
MLLMNNDQMSNFEKVVKFNTTFEAKMNKEPQYDLFDKDPELVKFRLSLIREEINELVDAFNLHNFKEVIDALADILYVVYGAFSAFGVNPDNILNSMYADKCKNLLFKPEYVTNFDKIIEFNPRLVAKNKGVPDFAIFTNSPHLIRFITSEMVGYINKLGNNVNEKNFSGVITNLTRLIYMSYATFIAFDVNANEAFDIVHNSNMSKACSSEQDAIDTIKKYKNHYEKIYDSPAYRLSKDGKCWIIYNESTSKILKSIKYKHANFKRIILGYNDDEDLIEAEVIKRFGGLLTIHE